MKVWSFYDPETGLFSGRVFCGNARALEANIPSGLHAVEGEFDHLSQRVDLASGQVVDYRPPSPDADHEWSSEARRWLLTREAADSLLRRVEVLAQIEELERKQVRPQREISIDPENSDARQRLQSIDREISELRRDL